MRLSDTKTSTRTVLLTPAVEAVLDRIPRDGDSPWVIAGRTRGVHLVNADALWKIGRASCRERV